LPELGLLYKTGFNGIKVRVIDLLINHYITPELNWIIVVLPKLMWAACFFPAFSNMHKSHSLLLAGELYFLAWISGLVVCFW
jgi:hypothetical protein